MYYKFALMGLIVLIAGCGGGNGDPPQPPADAPEVTSASVSPTELSFYGGEVTITAEATGGRAIAGVRAVITAPGVEDTVNLSRSNTQWVGKYEAPVNDKAAPVTYTAAVRATDNTGAHSPVVTREFQVGGLPAGPPPPPEF